MVSGHPNPLTVPCKVAFQPTQIKTGTQITGSVAFHESGSKYGYHTVADSDTGAYSLKTPGSGVVKVEPYSGDLNNIPACDYKKVDGTDAITVSAVLKNHQPSSVFWTLPNFGKK